MDAGEARCIAVQAGEGIFCPLLAIFGCSEILHRAPGRGCIALAGLAALQIRRGVWWGR